MEPGSRIKGYVIIGEAGRGGMGVVYHARDEALDRDVAIKVLPELFAVNPDRMARFQREAKLLAVLDHPNIASIYELVEMDDQAFVVMQYVQGETLADLTSRGPMPVEEVARIGMEIAGAMAYAHGKGVIHRDLKPANVKLDAEGHVKVLDFGLAKAVLDETPVEPEAGSNAGSRTAESTMPPSAPAPTPPPESNRDVTATDLGDVWGSRGSQGSKGSTMPSAGVTSPGLMMGTIGYASPEQIRGRPVDRRTDIFSFGSLLFEMLAGGPPFPAETVADGVGMTLHKEPDWASLPAHIHPRLRLLLRRCLAKDRDSRLCDLGDARLELAELPTGLEDGAPVAAQRGRGRLIATAAAFLLVIAAFVTGTRLGTSPVETPSEPETPRRLELMVNEGMSPSNLKVSRDGSRVFSAMDIYVGSEFAWDPQNMKTRRKLCVRDRGSDRFEVLADLSGRSGFAISPDGGKYVIIDGSKLQRGKVDSGVEPVPLGSVPGVIQGNTAAAISPAVQGVVWFDADRLLVARQDEDGNAVLSFLDAGTGDVFESVPIGSMESGSRFAGLIDRFDEDRVLAAIVIEEDGDVVFGLAAISTTTGKVDFLVRDAGDGRLIDGTLLYTREDALHRARLAADGSRLLDAGEPVLDGLRAQFNAHAEFELTDEGTLHVLPGGSLGQQRRIFSNTTDRNRPSAFESAAYGEFLSVSGDGSRLCISRRLPDGRMELWGGTFDPPRLTRILAAPPEGGISYFFLSHDGEQLLVSRRIPTPNGPDTVLEIAPFRGNSTPTRIWSFRENGSIFATSFHPDGTRLVGHRSVSDERTGANRMQLVHIDLRTGEIEVAHAPEEGAVLGMWSPDGGLLSFQRFMTAFGSTQPKGFVFDPSTGETLAIGSEPMYEKQWITGDDGSLGIVYWEDLDSARYIPIKRDADGALVAGTERPWSLVHPEGTIFLSMDTGGGTHTIVIGDNDAAAGHVELVEHWWQESDSGVE